MLLRPLAIMLCTAATLAAELPQSYKPYLKDGKPSSSFSIRYRGALCVITPNLSTDKNAKPTFTKADDSSVKLTGGKSIRQSKSTIHIFRHSRLNPTFPFKPDFKLSAKDRIVAISPDGKRDAGYLLYNPGNLTPYSPNMGPIPLMVITDKEDYKLRLKPGSPVFLEKTGQLIGSVAPTYSITNKNELYFASDCYYFEPLRLDTVNVPKPIRAKHLAGVPFRKSIDKNNFRWLLPDQIWMQDLNAKSSSSIVPAPDHSNILRPDTPFLYRASLSNTKAYKSRPAKTILTLSGETLEIHQPSSKPHKLLQLLTQAYGKPALYSAYVKEPNKKSGAIFEAYWKLPAHTISLEYSHGIFSIHGYITLQKGSSNENLIQSSKYRPTSKAPSDIIKAYDKWLTDSTKLKS